MNQHATASAEATTNAAAHRWTLDRGHSAVGFSVRHLMITNVRGEFGSFRADVTYDPARPEATELTATIDVASLDTREPKRDEDLRGPLFFDVEHHPEMRFVSRRARRAEEGGLDLDGELTMRGTTRPVTLAIRDISGPAVDMRGNVRLGATATTVVERSSFGMTWNKALETGGVVVGDRVKITLEISLVRSA